MLTLNNTETPLLRRFNSLATIVRYSDPFMQTINRLLGMCVINHGTLHDVFILRRQCALFCFSLLLSCRSLKILSTTSTLRTLSHSAKVRKMMSRVRNLLTYVRKQDNRA